MALPSVIQLGLVDIETLNPRNVETLEFQAKTSIPDFICDYTQLRNLKIDMSLTVDESTILTLPSRI